MIADGWQKSLLEGQVIPACPLALTQDGEWSPKHQKALIRYYLDCGVGGLAVGVHTTQFAIRDHGLYEPLLQCIAELLNHEAANKKNFIRIAGLCGSPEQIVSEAGFAAELGFHLGLLSPSGLGHLSEDELVELTREVSERISVFGFYLHEAVGGRTLSSNYWRRIVKIENLQAIKIAAFNRYQTIDVMRAVEESGRDDLAIYTGNDDNIVADLLTPFQFDLTLKPRWMVGGLLGHWAVWTREAVEMLDKIKQIRQNEQIAAEWLSRNIQVTDDNAAIFDAANHFSGCIAGVNEVLFRQGLLPSNRCLNPDEKLSPGQAEEIDRVDVRHRDEALWIQENLQRWLDPCESHQL